MHLDEEIFVDVDSNLFEFVRDNRYYNNHVNLTLTFQYNEVSMSLFKYNTKQFRFS